MDCNTSTAGRQDSGILACPDLSSHSLHSEQTLIPSLSTMDLQSMSTNERILYQANLNLKDSMKTASNSYYALMKNYNVVKSVLEEDRRNTTVHRNKAEAVVNKLKYENVRLNRQLEQLQTKFKTGSPDLTGLNAEQFSQDVFSTIGLETTLSEIDRATKLEIERDATQKLDALQTDCDRILAGRNKLMAKCEHVQKEKADLLELNKQLTKQVHLLETRCISSEGSSDLLIANDADFPVEHQKFTQEQFDILRRKYEIMKEKYRAVKNTRDELKIRCVNLESDCPPAFSSQRETSDILFCRDDVLKGKDKTHVYGREREQLDMLINNLTEKYNTCEEERKTLVLKVAASDQYTENQDTEELKNKIQDIEDQEIMTNLRIENEKLTENIQQQKKEYDSLGGKFMEVCSKYHDNLQDVEIANQRFQNWDGMVAKCHHLQQLVDAKDTDLQKINSQNTSLLEVAEQIPILKQQAQIFEQDFNMERKAREEEHNMAEELKASLMRLQKQHHQLQDELSKQTIAGMGLQHDQTEIAQDAYRYNTRNQSHLRALDQQQAVGRSDAGAYGSAVSEYSGRSSRTAVDPSLYNTVYKPCVSCGKRFYDQTTLQEHMLNCT